MRPSTTILATASSPLSYCILIIESGCDVSKKSLNDAASRGLKIYHSLCTDHILVVLCIYTVQYSLLCQMLIPLEYPLHSEINDEAERAGHPS